jgi:hypothetical protein
MLVDEWHPGIKKDYNHFRMLVQPTYHQPSIISNFRPVSVRYRSEKLHTPEFNQLTSMQNIETHTSFKKGKMTKAEAASVNRRRRRIAIWASGRGVYLVLRDLLSTVKEPDIVEMRTDPGSSSTQYHPETKVLICWSRISGPWVCRRVLPYVD